MRKMKLETKISLVVGAVLFGFAALTFGGVGNAARAIESSIIYGINDVTGSNFEIPDTSDIIARDVNGNQIDTSNSRRDRYNEAEMNKAFVEAYNQTMEELYNSLPWDVRGAIDMYNFSNDLYSDMMFGTNYIDTSIKEDLLYDGDKTLTTCTTCVKEEYVVGYTDIMECECGGMRYAIGDYLHSSDMYNRN